MGLKLKNGNLGFPYIFGFGLVIVIGMINLVSCNNIDQDRAECADQVVGLATCLPYVGGDAKAPTQDCCGGLKTVLQKSKKCLCVLIKDRDDQSLGLKINLTLALSLPTACHSPANITQCVDLLHLPPNSKEAKEFEGTIGVKGGNGTSSAAIVNGNSDKNGQNPENQKDGSGDGMKRKPKFGIEILIWFFISSLLLFSHI